jgi:hypothetical protein
MSLRFGAYAVAALVLAACGQGLSSYRLSSLPATVNAPALVPAAKATPAYSMAIVLPERANVRPQLQEDVGSVKATTYVKKKRYIDVIEAPFNCELYSSQSAGPGKVGGCNILFDGSQSIKIKSATFEVYKEAKAKGCIMAKASYKGEASIDTTVASSYKPENTKTCW